jgi:predicted nucleic acid-binding protein
MTRPSETPLWRIWPILPIKVDPETDQRAWSARLRFAERHRLTLDDAAYLELALRRELSLATLDVQLRAAAESEGLRHLGSQANGDG